MNRRSLNESLPQTEPTDARGHVGGCMDPGTIAPRAYSASQRFQAHLSLVLLTSWDLGELLFGWEVVIGYAPHKLASGLKTRAMCWARGKGIFASSAVICLRFALRLPTLQLRNPA